MTNPVGTSVSGRQPTGDTGSVADIPVLGPWPQIMDNPIRDYEWGSTTTLARLQGRPSSGRPEAELWMGAHPSAPSRLLASGCAAGQPLDGLVTRRPLDLLGGEVFDRFGPRLPFLLKILAISRPLSVQVHPTAGRARSAFDSAAGSTAENRGGSCYVDPHPKPELLYALEPIDAMCGFRPVEDALRLLTMIGGERMTAVAGLLGGEGVDKDRIEAAFEKLVTWPDDDRRALVAEVRGITRRLLSEAGPRRPGRTISPEDRRALTWAGRLTRQHEADPLVAAPFLLDLVQLQPGETLFVPAGAPHAYLHGLGVEIMGNSDNVLRAGLTHKPIAVEELLRIVHGGSRPQRDIHESWVSPYEVIWSPGVPEFRLSRIWLHEPRAISAYPKIAGPQIVLCTAGMARVSCGGHDVELTPGRSAFVGATAGPITLTGPGEVFRAFTGDLTVV